MRKNFELFKIRNNINRCGIEVNFARPSKNEYGEPDDCSVDEDGHQEVLSVKGIYHEGNSYIKQNTEDGAKYRSKKTPMFLVLYEDGQKLKVGDVVKISENTFEVVALNDIEQGQVVLDVSLELKDGV